MISDCMANHHPKNQFQPGHTFSKGNQGAKWRMIHDRIWLTAWEVYGSDYMETLNQRRQSPEESISLKACETFFKCGRPSETAPLSPELAVSNKSLALCDQYGLSEEDLVELRKAEQEARQKKLEKLIEKRKKTLHDG